METIKTPEQIKRAMMTSTNKAFERYFRIESDEVRNVYELTRNADHKKKNTKIIKIKN